MIKAIIKEIIQVASQNEKRIIETIYFGGGTPGMLLPQEIDSIVNTVRSLYTIETGCEITLEVNPDDVNVERAQAWLTSGINRLSIGIQSFDEAELRWMNRAHTEVQSRRCIETIIAAGFNNFSTDLIYGGPLQNREILSQNIDILLGYNVPHISAYALTVEDKTVLHSRIQKGIELAPIPEMQAEMYHYLVDRLSENNIYSYEISNFCRAGMESRHNSNYWNGKAYLGFGPSAHSYNGDSIRSWNVANNALYVSLINAGKEVSENEMLTAGNKRNELIMISLRTSKGLDIDRLKLLSNEAEIKSFIDRADKFVREDLAEWNGRFLTLTPKGKFLADGIASDLFEG